MIKRNNWNFAKENQVRKIKINIVGEKLEWKMSTSNAQMECETIEHFLAES